MHSHSGSGDSMADMSMAMGGPDMFDLQQTYWAFVGAAIGLVFVAHLLNRLLAAHRLTGRADAAIFSPYATAIALSREISNASISSPLLRKWKCSLSVGKGGLVVANFVLVLILCFYHLDVKDEWQWENIGYQTGFITAAQLPLVVLLAGKRNIVGYLIGSSYERLSWLHRWVSRTVFLTATLHMGFWFRAWGRYDYIGQKLSTDKISQRGLAAWGILLWIFISSFAPIRRWNYEFFLVQHILTFIGFLAAVFLHLPAENKVWIWIPIVLYILDRALRTSTILYHNVGLFRQGNHGLLSCRAEIKDAGAGLSRITIERPPFRWVPGQHAFLQCHGVAPLQSHPFTIASLPEDGRLEFLVKARTGATRRFFAHARKALHLPSVKGGAKPREYGVIIDGPYGNVRTLRQFDSVVLIAGGCGATYTVPLMRDVVNGWRRQNPSSSIVTQFLRSQGAVTRHVRFVWVIRSRHELAWFSSQIYQAWKDTQDTRGYRQDVALEISIYVTCDTSLTSIEDSKPSGKEIELRTMSNLDHSSDYPTVSSEKPKADDHSVNSDSSTSSKRSELLKQGCNVEGACCCKRVVEVEGTIDESKYPTQAVCRCNEVESSSSIQSDQHHGRSELSVSKVQEAQSQNHAFKTFAGRPNCKNIIRDMLERAHGESAVVVCGPQGLNEDVRESVVALSDERAVCKGSGAHGIYFWAEGFSY